MLKQLLRSVCFLLVLAACEKTETAKPGPVLTDLPFTKTTTPPNQTQQEGIVSQVKAYCPNSCCKFSKIDVKETATREFDIRLKATVTGEVCLQVIYNVDTTVKVNAATKGKYLLRFYTQQQLFKTDTVQVN